MRQRAVAPSDAMLTLQKLTLLRRLEPSKPKLTPNEVRDLVLDRRIWPPGVTSVVMGQPDKLGKMTVRVIHERLPHDKVLQMNARDLFTWALLTVVSGSLFLNSNRGPLDNTGRYYLKLALGGLKVTLASVFMGSGPGQRAVAINYDQFDLRRENQRIESDGRAMDPRKSILTLAEWQFRNHASRKCGMTPEEYRNLIAFHLEAADKDYLDATEKRAA